MRITYDSKPEPSIIKDYSKMTDAQLEASVLYGWPRAIEEAKHRGWIVTLRGMHQAITGEAIYQSERVVIAKPAILKK